MQRDQVAGENYFFAADFVAFFDTTDFGVALAVTFTFAATGAGAAVAFKAVRCSRKALISALIFSLRSVSFAMLEPILAMALEVLDSGTFFATALEMAVTALAADFTTFAGAVTFFGVAVALGATFFFAVAILNFLLVLLVQIFTSRILSSIFHNTFTIVSLNLLGLPVLIKGLALRGAWPSKKVIFESPKLDDTLHCIQIRTSISVDNL